MIKKNYKEIETIKERGKKRYQQRLIEEKEAAKLIEEAAKPYRHDPWCIDDEHDDGAEEANVKYYVDKDGV